MEVEVLFATLPQGVPTTPLGHHCSSPDSSSGVLPKCCKHLCGPSRSQNKNRLRSWLRRVPMRAGTRQKTSRKPENREPTAAPRSAEPQSQCRRCIMPQLSHTGPAEPFPEMLPHPLHPAGLLSCWDRLRRDTSPLEGPGRGGCWAGAAATREEVQEPRYTRRGTDMTPSTPRSPPPYPPRQCLSGCFPLLFPLLAALPPSSDGWMGDRLTAHLLARQVMLTFIWLELHSAFF